MTQPILSAVFHNPTRAAVRRALEAGEDLALVVALANAKDRH